MANLNLLFDTGNSPVRKDDEAQGFVSDLQREISVIVGCIYEAHRNMLAELDGRPISYQNHLSKANRMHEQTKGLLTDAFGEAIRRLKYNRFGLFLDKS